MQIRRKCQFRFGKNKKQLEEQYYDHFYSRCIDRAAQNTGKNHIIPQKQKNKDKDSPPKLENNSKMVQHTIQKQRQINRKPHKTIQKPCKNSKHIKHTIRRHNRTAKPYKNTTETFQTCQSKHLNKNKPNTKLMF